ncbi:MAG: hypothetical protein ACD_80C00092G0013 [uncultured bacterium (gcode 4)]|uniref:Uncharacterized protein n=1 Tax=uncultured bacterium (gcode 4) TaxID=1234023 RepID=K1YIQ6_9BACT|nr:MAG: hypothetical protein ACD_80C00092G0013 [uncultured bacterium (gcode 4)]
MIQYIVILWALVSLWWCFIYLKETIKGNTKPNRVTRLMRAIAPMIATWAALSDGIHRAALPVFMSWFGPFLIFLASFVNKKAYWKLEKFDYICGVSSALALLLWWITKEPVIAIIFAIISDAFAAIPTLIKWWKHPETETVQAFIGGLFSASTAFFALKVFSFTELAFPIYLVVMNILLISSISIGKIKNKHKLSE